jgi:acetylornithine/N-succinyldiaminopimelate aminotransferase
VSSDGTTTDGLVGRYGQALMNTFGPPTLALVRGEGAHVWDEHGREYVDLLGGIAVNALGHGHPALVEAVAGQLATLGHVSNFFTTRPQVELAERLLGLVAPDGAPAGSRVFFASSGTEANEAAMKLSRRTGRTHLVATDGAFHGRTMGALALTSKAAYREPFEPLPGEVTFVPYGDADALAVAVTDRTAAVVVEPVQGEAGVVVPPRDYLAAARATADRHGSLLWLDEVQSGVGRTGEWFAHRNPRLHDPVLPDVVTVAKGLGGGLPIGACLGLGEAGGMLGPGNHGTTFGGNPVACAAALAVLDTIEAEDLLAHVRAVGERLRGVLLDAPGVTEVAGDGLMLGAQLDDEYAAQAVAAGQDAGFVLNATGPARLRFVPPLVLTDADVDAFADAWPGIHDAAVAAHAEAASG